MNTLERLQNAELGLASEAGLTDGDYIDQRTEWIDAGFVGGIYADDETREAAMEMIARGRDEFVYDADDAPEFVRREFEKIDEDTVRGVNVRSSTLDGLLEVGRVVEEFDGVLEINAHCRQNEMVEVGCGHALMRDVERLEKWVRSLDTELDVVIGLKTRARVVGDDAQLARGFEDAGGDVIHVDCMDSPGVIDEINDATDLVIIGNNGVRSPADVRDYLERGADMVSTARGGRRIESLKRIRGNVETDEKCRTQQTRTRTRTQTQTQT
ncbi:MAG: tRNA-dihydrouridine synthase [Halobacteria archaeon]|nr:tRNA-dihydrouridine synthase [Halobacteria archaeon]